MSAESEVEYPSGILSTSGRPGRLFVYAAEKREAPEGELSSGSKPWNRWAVPHRV